MIPLLLTLLATPQVSTQGRVLTFEACGKTLQIKPYPSAGSGRLRITVYYPCYVEVFSDFGLDELWIDPTLKDPDVQWRDKRATVEACDLGEHEYQTVRWSYTSQRWSIGPECLADKRPNLLPLTPLKK